MGNFAQKMANINGTIQLIVLVGVLIGGVLLYFWVVKPVIKCLRNPLDCLSTSGEAIGKKGLDAVTSGFTNLGGDWTNAGKDMKKAKTGGDKAKVVGQAALNTWWDVTPIGMTGRFVKNIFS